MKSRTPRKPTSPVSILKNSPSKKKKVKISSRETLLKDEIQILRSYQYKMETEMKQILASLENSDISGLFQKYVDSVNLNEAKDIEISELKQKINKMIRRRKRSRSRRNSRLDFSLSPTSRSNSESALKIRKRAQSVRSGRFNHNQSFLSNNSDLQEVFGTQGNSYYDVMHLQPAKEISVRPTKALPRSPSPKKKKKKLAEL